MSVTVHWRPLGEVTAYFKGGTSTSYDKVKRAFGTRIETYNVPALRAMAIAADDPFYDEIADTVERHKAIEIWGEH